jgi:hypothetical protein
MFEKHVLVWTPWWHHSIVVTNINPRQTNPATRAAARATYSWSAIGPNGPARWDLCLTGRKMTAVAPFLLACIMQMQAIGKDQEMGRQPGRDVRLGRRSSQRSGPGGNGRMFSPSVFNQGSFRMPFDKSLWSPSKEDGRGG